MKKLTITEIINQAHLEGLKLEDVNSLISDLDRARYSNIRFTSSDNFEYTGYDIVGDREETDKEYEKRISKIRKEKEAKKKAKLDRVQWLEKELRKLKRGKLKLEPEDTTVRFGQEK